MAACFRLRLTKLNFISAVDEPAQETAKVLLMKRAGGGFRVHASGDAKHPFAKAVQCVSLGKKDGEEMGLVFGWALTDLHKGEKYVDLQGDNVPADDSLIKAALGFMDGGGLADEMHDEEATGKVAFCMPMTPDVAKAFGIETETTGLMIAMKPSADAFAKFKSGEYTGFSIGGEGEREPLDKSARKRARLTSSDEGHSHLIYDDSEQGGETSWSQEEGSEYGHSHAWVRADDGTITVGESNGHTHTIVSTDAPPKSKSKEPAMNTNKMSEEDLKAKIAQLEEELEEKRKSLDEMEAKAKAAEDEAAEEKRKRADLEKRLDPEHVVYKSLDGEVFTKDDDERLVKMAKRADAAEAARADAEIEKSAGKVIKSLKGDTATKIALLKAVNGISDEKVRESVMETLKGADGAMEIAFGPAGHNGLPQGADDVSADDPLAKLNDLAKKRAESDRTTFAKAMDAVLDTEEGRDLHAQSQIHRTAAR